MSALCTEYVGEHGQVIRAAHDVSFEVPQGKLFTLLGPSGCGKTTTLRSIAGLEKPRSGEIVVGGRVIYSSKQGVFVPPNRRGLGMVFQSYAIWPHMTVFENVAFGFKVRGFGRERARPAVERALSLVDLAGFA
ncbi:MAG TPA: ABC transporter ATP-binding protein, partial [Burkholderiales bacterium]|nr:ABC transporter ATP-binding protein [Burkholderiales bacterium]